VLAKLLTYGSNRPPMAQIGLDLSVSPSEVHAALRRLGQARLVRADSHGIRPLLPAVEEFLLHGVKYAFPPRRGEVTRGVPTSYAAAPLAVHIAGGADLPPVWPYAEGTVRGVSLEPLYKTVPAAALRDPALYEFLALIDALRDGRARERKLAESELRSRLKAIADERSQPADTRARR
jgi:hypothetical protein